MIRLPSLETGSKYMTCCGKVICSGCYYAPLYDDQGNIVAEKKCPFCRTPHPKTNEEVIKRLNKRVEASDAEAMYTLGGFYRNGKGGYPQDHKKALELYHRAGELGYAKAYVCIGYAYDFGLGVEQDKSKAKYYYELAAIGGDVEGRFNLASTEFQANNADRALKHHLIAVGCGSSHSLNTIKNYVNAIKNYAYSYGHGKEEYYTKALQYQTYVSEITSVQRDEAAAANDNYRYY